MLSLTGTQIWYSSTLLLTLFAGYLRAAVFTSPLEYDVEALTRGLERRTLGETRSNTEVTKPHKRRNLAQFPITGNDGTVNVGNEAEIYDGWWFVPYLINATVGTPPQTFRLMIDLAWDTLFIPSADCQDDCGPLTDKLHFFSNESSTYSPLCQPATFIYGTDRFEGIFANETLGLAGLEITHQTFLDVEIARSLGFISFYGGYDGVLGLAPNMNDSVVPGLPARAPSPWSNIVSHDMLDANLFAIEAPSGPFKAVNPTRHGEIKFGGINEKYASSEFTQLPLSNYTDLAWAVEAQWLTWENETHPLHEDFTNFTLAGFDSTVWYTALPNYWTRHIYASVEHDCGPIDCTVACEQRASMPNITFGIGGQSITLTAFDYVVEVVSAEEETFCIFDMYSSRDQYPVDAIVFGRPFLEAYYSVFDLDAREVRVTRRIE